MSAFVDQGRSLSDEIAMLGHGIEKRITIPGVMRGKGRPRFGNGRTYTDAKTVNAETWIKACAVEQLGTPLMVGPLYVVVDIGVPYVKSWPKRTKARAMAQLLWPTSKPDIDNCVKLIADALNGILWHDDSQIVSLAVHKRYVENPVTTVRAWQV